MDKERYICYMDIMGFKDYVYRHSHDEVVELLTKVTNLVDTYKGFEQNNKGLPIERDIPHILVFSDTIILISKGNTDRDFEICSNISNYIFGHCIVNQIPIKGAMAYGEITYRPESSLLVGKPLIDAYNITEEVLFYGIVLHHTIEKKIKETGQIKMLEESKDFVPMKEGRVFHYFLPVKNSIQVSILGTDEEVKLLFEKLYHSVSGKVRRYVDNTIAVHKIGYYNS